MPRKRDQQYEDRRQRIIDGALKAFATKGFEEATNKEIAEAAGINSPSLIYHYFKDKTDLFGAVLEQHIPLLQLVSHPEELSDLPLREALLRIGRAYLGMLGSPDSVAFLRMMLGEATRRPSVARIIGEAGPGRGLPFIAEYLRGQMDAGRLRRVEPAFAARYFMSPFVTLLLMRVILQQPDVQQIDAEQFLAQSVDLFLHGMLPLPHGGSPDGAS
jgi:TetR/AcrR family transcriptional regulator, mexJK operon transcriptional repressor